MVIMTLEDKIAQLPPELREEVELFVDFILAKKAANTSEPWVEHQEEEEDIDFGFSSPMPPREEIPSQKPRTGPSGIIMAAERPIADADDDVIDFADINSRFGHVKEDEDGKLIRRPRWMFDWL